MLFSVAAIGLSSCKKDEQKTTKVTYSIECKDCFAIFHETVDGQDSPNPFEPLTHVVGSWSKTVENTPDKKHYMGVFINHETGETQRVKASITSDSNKRVSFDEILTTKLWETGKSLTLIL